MPFLRATPSYRRPTYLREVQAWPSVEQRELPTWRAEGEEARQMADEREGATRTPKSDRLSHFSCQSRREPYTVNPKSKTKLKNRARG